jgi:hypothetical protein
MDKSQLITLINEKLKDGTINTAELKSLISGNSETSSHHSAIGDYPIVEEHLSTGEKMMKVLYIIGSVILLAGIVILLAQNWDEIGFIGRVASTLGIAIVSYVIGWALSRGEHDTLSQLAFAISAALIPAGIAVFLNEVDIRLTNNLVISLSLVIAVFFAITQYYVRNRILILITIIYSTVLYYAVIYKIFDSSQMYILDDILKIAVIMMGIAYYLISYGYIKNILENRSKVTKEENAVSGVLYTAGTLSILIPFVTFDGVFDFIAFLVIFAVAYLGFFIKSKVTFFIATLFMVIQIISITAEYFADSFGWPFMLILFGGLIIGIAFSSIKIWKSLEKKD